MLTASVASWAVWAPGVEDPDAWARWCLEPGPIGTDGAPPVTFIPPLVRRRCSRFSRMVLHVAFACCPPEGRTMAPTVFASRHGDTSTNIALLESLARGQAISPTRFSHSVHNGAAGLFSIATGNCQPSVSMAARGATFGLAFLETLLLLRRHASGQALLIAAEEPLPRPFDRFADGPEAAYAVAVLLRSGTDLSFEFGVGGHACTLRWPLALEFVRWLLSGESRLEVAAQGQRFAWGNAPARVGNAP